MLLAESAVGWMPAAYAPATGSNSNFWNRSSLVDTEYATTDVATGPDTSCALIAWTIRRG